jgi:undecaprenyl-diphosphatase
MLPALLLPLGFAPDALEWAGVRLPAALDLASKRLLGWPELGRAVGEVLATGGDRPFVASDRYQIASQLAFYVPGHPTVYNANFGRRMNQYDLWGGWETLIGRDGVFVMYGAAEVPDELRTAFRTVARVRTLEVPLPGRPPNTFTIFNGQEFRGFAPRPFTGF